MWMVVYNGRDITQELGSLPEHLMYEEQIGKKANTIEFKFADTFQYMQNNPPTVGGTLTVSLGYKGGPMTPCGTFEVDAYQLEVGDIGDKFMIKGIQAGISNAVRTHNAVAYENQNLVQVANTVAARHGMTAVTDAISPNVVYKRLTQHLESDIDFLHRVSSQHGYDFQIRDNQLIFYSRFALNTQTPSGSLTRDMIHRARFETQSLGKKTYKAATVTYYESSLKEPVSGTVTDPTVTSADTLKATERVETAQHAQLKAQGYLQAANKHKHRGNIYMPGTLQWRAGQTINVSGFGFFDKTTYIVEKARHILDKNGWLTELELNLPVTAAAPSTQSTIIKEDSLKEPPVDQPGR